MDVHEIITFNHTEKETLELILSNACDTRSSKGALISLEAFGGLIDDLITWKNSLLKQQSTTTQKAKTKSSTDKTIEFNEFQGFDPRD